jgi:CheY-like chemotaxis protein
MEFPLSAPAAMERLKTIADPSPILILSDINMPGMSGLEMLPKVRAERPNVPVIMTTTYGDEGTQAVRHWIADQADRFRLAASGNRRAARSSGVIGRNSPNLLRRMSLLLAPMRHADCIE